MFNFVPIMDVPIGTQINHYNKIIFKIAAQDDLFKNLYVLE